MNNLVERFKRIMVEYKIDKRPKINPLRNDFNDIGRDRTNLEYMPNQKRHQIISFIKSGVRILGYCFIPFNLITATIILVLSEVIGIVEEMV